MKSQIIKCFKNKKLKVEKLRKKQRRKWEVNAGQIHSSRQCVRYAPKVCKCSHMQLSYLLGCGSTDFSFLGTPDFLHPVLPLLSLFTRHLLLFEESLLQFQNNSGFRNKVNTKFLESDPYSGQAMFGFKLFKVVHRVIYKSKSGRFATTEICPESKAGDYIWSDFVHLGQLLRNLLLRN